MEALGRTRELALGAPATRRYRRRGTSNLLRMGHCAPAVVQTLLDELGVDAP